MRHLNKGANATFSFLIVVRWMNVRLDALCMVVSSLNVILCIAFKNKIDNALISFALQIVTDLLVGYSVTLRGCAEFDNYMICAKRVMEYTELEMEDDLRKEIGDRLKEELNWP
jgi:hypothetical protein